GEAAVIAFGAQIVLDLAVMVAGDHADGARWNAGALQILNLMRDDGGAADIEHAFVLVGGERAEALGWSRRQDHRLMLARHASLDRAGDALHRGDAIEGIVADRG